MTDSSRVASVVQAAWYARKVDSKRSRSPACWPTRLPVFAVAGGEVVDLLPVAPVLRQLLVEVAPGVVGVSQRLTLDVVRQREEFARHGEQAVRQGRVESMADGLEEAPVRQARSIAARVGGAVEPADVDDGNALACIGSPHASRGLARVHPLRQQAVGVQCRRLRSKATPAASRRRCSSPLRMSVEQVGAAADVLAADVDLRDRRRAGALLEHGADLDAQVVALEPHRVEVDALVGDRPAARTACAPPSRTRTTRART